MSYSQFFLTKLLTLGILFSTALAVAKLVILGISPLTWRVVLVAKSIISGILYSTFFFLALYTSF